MTAAREFEPVRIEREGDVAVIVIDNPPINAGSIEVRRGVLGAVNEVERDQDLVGAVLIGAGKSFIAGSDLREFGQPLEDPQLPAVIAAVASCSKPVVAALHGVALGGGFELALGCDGRLALEGTRVGLPEVTLGMIPGAGGTQRVPRLAGLAAAIEMICSGRRIDAGEAYRLGLVDSVVASDLRGSAVQFLRDLGGRKKPVMARDVPAGDSAAIDAAAEKAVKQGRKRPAVMEAIRCIRLAMSTAPQDALRIERDVFQRLRVAPEAFALRHLFFAEREAAKIPGLDGVTPADVSAVAVIGAGTMGAGIAICAIEAGCRVRLIDADPNNLDRGAKTVRRHFDDQVAKGRMTAVKAESAMARFAVSQTLDAAGADDLIIEAVFEDLAVKQDVFATLGRIVRPQTIIASNTSYLDIEAIGRDFPRPENLIGLHFFSPAPVMRLVEVVRTGKSSPQAMATGIDFARRLGKLGIPAGNRFGFIGNRIYNAYRRQCEFMLEEGALPQEVDEALEQFGFAMGPFAVGDLSGLDIGWRMRKQFAGSRNPAHRYCDLPDRLCEMGRLGRKTGAGYYDYRDGKRAVDAVVTQLIERVSAEKGFVRRKFTAEEIQGRALLTMANEAAHLLSEGVALRSSDIDLVFVNGYGFPKWEGGPVYWARLQGTQALSQPLVELARASGAGFEKADLKVLAR